MIWDTAKEYGSKVYSWYGENNDAMDEVDRKAQELFDQDMKAARQLPVIGAYWMFVEGDYWYVTHDDLSISEMASTYLPVDRNVEPVWNKRFPELWNYQPTEFQFMATNYGLKNYPNKVINNGIYWGPLPNGTPVRMPTESVDIAMSHGVVIPNLDPAPEPDLDENKPIAVPNIFPSALERSQIYSGKISGLIKGSEERKFNYVTWGLGGVAILGAIGTGLYFWRIK